MHIYKCPAHITTYLVHCHLHSSGGGEALSVTQVALDGRQVADGEILLERDLSVS